MVACVVSTESTGSFEVEIFPIEKNVNSELPRYEASLMALEKGVATWDNLRVIARYGRASIKDEDYKKVISRFDPDLSLPKGEFSTVTSFGRGRENLNRYRVLSSGNTVLFEKIFRIDSKSFAVSEWVDQYIRPVAIEHGWSIPRLVEKRTGNRVIAAYYEFVEGSRFKRRSVTRASVEITSALRSVDPDLQKSFPCTRSGASAHIHFAKGIESISAALKANGHEDAVEMVEKDVRYLDSCGTCFCHGDLIFKNLLKPRMVIDWDRSGYYPHGLDIAHAMSKSMKLKSVTRSYKKLARYLESAGLIDIDLDRTMLMASFLYARRLNRSRANGNSVKLYQHARERLAARGAFA